jgi:hypothetical protein
MKLSGLNQKKVIITLCALVVGIFGLALFILAFISPIQGMKVYVEVPTNAPAWVIAEATTNESMKQLATNTWSTTIPFESGTNRFVSENDIVQMKQAIPWNKTILHLYFPERIVVESQTRARAEFSRQHMGLRVHLEKTDAIWQVEYIRPYKWELAGPPNLQQRIAELLPR